MELTYIKELIVKYNNGTATEKERAMVIEWYESIEGERPEFAKGEFDALKGEVYQSLKQHRKGSSSTVKLWPRLVVAAAAVIGMAIGVYFYTSRHLDTPSSRTAGRELTNDIAPGKNTATLTSADGKTIILSEAKTGVAIDATTLSYNDGTTIDPSALGMTNGDSRSLEVSTPRGGTYSIILQDGTKVWLNADSKLGFYSNYRNKAQRIVILTGEAYFEVATAYMSVQGRTTKQPFLVLSNGQRIEVLGTRFNVSVYPGDPIATTTLLEGSIALNKTLLKPNQQAQRMGKGGLIISNVDPELAIAWKNGKFRFENASLQEVMKQLARWYDVEIQYTGEIPERKFTGYIDRNLKASEALDILKFMKVNFKIEGKTIIVSK